MFLFSVRPFFWLAGGGHCWCVLGGFRVLFEGSLQGGHKRPLHQQTRGLRVPFLGWFKGKPKGKPLSWRVPLFCTSIIHFPLTNKYGRFLYFGTNPKLGFFRSPLSDGQGNPIPLSESWGWPASQGRFSRARFDPGNLGRCFCLTGGSCLNLKGLGHIEPIAYDRGIQTESNAGVVLHPICNCVGDER